MATVEHAWMMLHDLKHRTEEGYSQRALTQDLSLVVWEHRYASAYDRNQLLDFVRANPKMLVLLDALLESGEVEIRMARPRSPVLDSLGRWSFAKLPVLTPVIKG